VPELTASEERTNEQYTVETDLKRDNMDNLYVNIINSERLKEHCE